jgi:hypothetical protein
MVACTHDDLPDLPQPPNDEHPIVAVLAVIAIVAAIVLITWARFEVHGTEDIQAALTEAGPTETKSELPAEVDAAVTTNRFATGVSPQ